MKTNVGNLDIILRIVVGVALIVAALTGYFTPWGWIGIIPLATAIMGWCPGYSLLNVSSCPLSKGE